MSGELKLNCWVIGDNRNSILPIQLNENKTVGELKGSIKLMKAPKYDPIPQDVLVLLQVSIPFKGSYTLVGLHTPILMEAPF